VEFQVFPSQDSSYSKYCRLTAFCFAVLLYIIATNSVFILLHTARKVFYLLMSWSVGSLSTLFWSWHLLSCNHCRIAEQPEYRMLKNETEPEGENLLCMLALAWECVIVAKQ